ncbi:sigma factor-like helix-turn-helix DNA-binding protein [Actinomadura sp. CNU-125]|uniref:sigma factor-like helix-turn-helix DNA-binding protein n=1 Tax=Actinomadura sp. CNU-125 TaxID=1904961 RepID=UPI0021CD127D|nr:sigma factor-like helix-turn-helix DNA-binding protein [Actinomadura sp. CNU-125]
MGARDRPEVTNPRAYLVRIAVNAALARQAAISRRRETYIGPWLPDPLVAGADESAERTEAVSMALLVVLETLSPLERAVFVLHEVFGYPHPEIAAILDRSPSAVRQLAHRARAHVHARRPRFPTDPGVQRQATERFLRAALGGDIGTLLEILAPDAPSGWTPAASAAPPCARSTAATASPAPSPPPRPAGPTSTSTTAPSTATRPPSSSPTTPPSPSWSSTSTATTSPASTPSRTPTNSRTPTSAAPTTVHRADGPVLMLICGVLPLSGRS